MSAEPTEDSRTSLTNRFFIYAPFALFVVLAVGVSARWFWEASAYSKRLDGMNGRELSPGVTLHFATKKIAGFPFRLDAVFKSLEIDIATPHGPASWRTEDFALHRLTYGTDQTVFEASGKQTLNWRTNNGAHRSLVFDAGSMRASAIDSGNGLDRFDLAIATLRSAPFSADDIQFHVRRDPVHDAVDIFIGANGVRLGPKFRSPMGDTIDHLMLAATASPGTAFAAWRAGATDWPSAFRAFQSASGSVHVDQAEIAFDRLDATGKGTLGLDANARPEGTLDLRIARYTKFLEAAHIGGAHVGIAHALVDRAAKAGSDEMGRLGIVVGAKDGIVYAGDEPVGMVGSIY